MSDATGGLRYVERLGLRGIGALGQEQRVQIEDWLRVNFCDEDSFNCTLSQLPDGGLLLEDPDESVGGEEEFGVHRLEDAAGAPAFFVALFERVLLRIGAFCAVGRIIGDCRDAPATGGTRRWNAGRLASMRRGSRWTCRANTGSNCGKPLREFCNREPGRHALPGSRRFSSSLHTSLKIFLPRIKAGIKPRRGISERGTSVP